MRFYSRNSTAIDIATSVTDFGTKSVISLRGVISVDILGKRTEQCLLTILRSYEPGTRHLSNQTRQSTLFFGSFVRLGHHNGRMLGPNGK